MIPGLLITAASVLLQVLPSFQEKDQVVFFLLGTGVSTTLGEIINTSSRRDAYLRDIEEERMLYPVTEPALADSRMASQLGANLYYFYYDGLVQHKRRCQLLAKSLRIADVLEDSLNAPSTSLPEQMNPIRAVGMALRDRRGRQVSGAFNSVVFLMLMAGSDIRNTPSLLKDRKELVSAQNRVLNGLRDKGADDFVVEYAHEVTSKVLENQCPEANIKAFCQLIRAYLSSYGEVNDSGKVADFLSRKLPIDSSQFLSRANNILEFHTGSIRIVSGTGSFSGITSTNKDVTTRKGERLVGSIQVITSNNMPELAMAPLIMVPTWKGREGNYVEINSWIQAGESKYDIQVNLEAPSESVPAYLLIAFEGVTHAEYVASCTDENLGYSLWGDGQDLVDCPTDSIVEAQRVGSVDWKFLGTDGYKPRRIPLDALRIVPA